MSADRPIPLRSARIAVALLLFINLINYLDRYVLSAVEPLVRDALLTGEGSQARMGLLATAFLVTYMLAAPLFGWMGDRFRRWSIIGAGVILWSLATGACGLAQSFTMLLVCRVLVGVGEAAWGPIAPTILADMYPVSKRGTVLAWFNVALPVGSALGYLVGGQVAHHMNGAFDVAGWRWAFLVVVPPGLILGTLSFFRKDPPRALVGSRRFRFADAKQLLRIPSYIFNNLGMTAMTFAVGGMSFWMPTYIHEFRMGGGSDEAGREQLAHITFVFGIIIVVAGLAGTLTGGYLGDWLRPRIKNGGAYLYLSGISMLLAFPMFIMILIAPFPTAWVFMGLALFLIFINTGPTNTVIANVSPSPLRATAYALNILVIHSLGDAISPPLIGAVSDHFNHNMNIGFAVVGAFMLLSGLAWLRGARHLERDTARANDPVTTATSVG